MGYSTVFLNTPRRRTIANPTRNLERGSASGISKLVTAFDSEQRILLLPHAVVQSESVGGYAEDPEGSSCYLFSYPNLDSPNPTTRGPHIFPLGYVLDNMFPNRDPVNMSKPIEHNFADL